MRLGNAKPNAESPYKRKNRIKHQVAIELGILIFILLWVFIRGSTSLLSRETHGKVTRYGPGKHPVNPTRLEW